MSRTALLEDVAARVIDGHVFDPDALRAIADSNAGGLGECVGPPAAARGNAILRLRIAEDALRRQGGAQIDANLAELRTAIVTSLRCDPEDPFLWLVLFWNRATLDGYRPSDLDLLRLSYTLGRNEGWIMVRRSQLVLPLLGYLPPDLEASALQEFAKLLELQTSLIAAEIFASASPNVRAKLLGAIGEVPQAQRERFAQLLYSKGVEDAVPGVTPKQRPWH